MNLFLKTTPDVLNLIFEVKVWQNGSSRVFKKPASYNGFKSSILGDQTLHIYIYDASHYCMWVFPDFSGIANINNQILN